MILREIYQIPEDLVQEALNYAVLSRQYTSNRHDFHPGGLDNKQKKMFEGKLGEKGVKMFFMDNNIVFEEDGTSHTERDNFDFLIEFGNKEYTIDVKTRTEHFHTRTLEMVEQAHSNPKDIYISARLYREDNTVKLLGWFTKEDMFDANQIENQGYLNNYVMYDEDLRPISELYDLYLSKCIDN